MDVQCDPFVAAGWLAFVSVLILGLLHYIEDKWTERRIETKKAPKETARRVPRYTIGSLQLLFIGAIGALISQSRFGASIVDAVSDGFTWLGLRTTGSYAMGRGAIALVVAVALALLWFFKPTVPVAVGVGLALLVLAGISPQVESVIGFVVDRVLSAGSGILRWLSERQIR
jgi:hypothetical protein